MLEDIRTGNIGTSYISRMALLVGKSSLSGTNQTPLVGSDLDVDESSPKMLMVGQDTIEQ